MLNKIKDTFTSTALVITEKLTKSKSVATVALMGASLAVANNSAVVMAGGWEGFEQNLTEWFRDGLGGPGMKGVGVAILVIGIITTIISFVLHRYNPQSRFPGPFMTFLVAVAGAIAMSGLEAPIKFVEAVRDTIYGWLGL